MAAINTRRRRGSGDDESNATPREELENRVGDRGLKIGVILLGMVTMLIVVSCLNHSVVGHLSASDVSLDQSGKKVLTDAPSNFVVSFLRGLRKVEIATEPVNAYRGTLEMVKMNRDQLISGMDVKNRTDLIAKMYRGETLLNPSPTRMHGVVGINPDGTDIWTPTDLGGVEVKDMDIVKELRVGGGFNIRMSDSIPLDRDAADFRAAECHRDWNINQLPRGSIIIIFHNEPRSTLFRSIHSIYNYTPPELLEEIILVDDASTVPWVKELESTVEKYPKLRLIRLSTRSGIVAARTAGIQAAKAPNFFILDSHIEVEPQWIEPMLYKLGEDPHVIVMPQVDSIDAATFKSHGGGIGCTLGFLWRMIEHSFTPIEGVSPPDRLFGSPIKLPDGTTRKRDVNDGISSPTMAGGLFGANKEFFLGDLGGYDMGFQYWGTENLELSFRVWQCGGRLECLPCSRVGHVFRRGGVGYQSPPHSTTKNKIRLMVGWMDNYADLAFKVLDPPADLDYGDVTPVVQHRANKQCKSFRWYLDNVYPESMVKDLKRDVPYLGQIRSAASEKGVQKCIVDSDVFSPGQGTLSLKTCESVAGAKFVYYVNKGWIADLHNDENCILTTPTAKTGWCEHGGTTWKVQPVSMPSVDGSHGSSVQLKKGDSCLTNVEGTKLLLKTCASVPEPNQIWLWDPYNPPSTWTPAPRGNK